MVDYKEYTLKKQEVKNYYDQRFDRKIQRQRNLF